MRPLKNALLFPLLALSSAGLLGGCQTTPAEASPSTAVTTREGKKLKVGISIPAADHGWTAGVKWWAERAMELYPDVEWTLATAENPDKQIKDLETMMVKGVDAMVVLATESAPITPIAEQIYDRGILLVNVDRGFLKPVAHVFIEGDNKAFGRKSAQFIVDRLKKQGKILVLTGIPSTVDTDRVNAAMEVFAQHKGIEILDRQSGGWNRQKAYEVTQTMLLKHPQVDAIWASDDDMALGVEQALREAGRDRNIWILGGAGMKDIVKKVMDRDPLYPANVTYSPSMIAVGIHQAISIIRDGNRDRIMQFMPRHMMIDVELITPENAKDHYFPDSVF
jgi:ribose transport system substrate-binding protein